MTILSRRELVDKIMAAGLLATAAPLIMGSGKEKGLPATIESGQGGRKRHEKLSRGFNLPAWVDRIDGIAPGPVVLKNLRRLGFSSVRIPVDPVRLLSTDSYIFLLKVANAITDLNRRGFAVILDMHMEAGLARRFSSDPKGAGQVLEKAWDRLAPVLADSPADINYAELLNEPPMASGDWIALRDRLAYRVRRQCPGHTLMWGAARYQSIDETVSSPLLADDNQIVAVHYYTPMGFTHQGAGWGSPGLKAMKYLPFPARSTDWKIVQFRNRLRRDSATAALDFLEQEFNEDWTEGRIANDFARLGKWSENNSCPVVLNEFGVLNFHVDPFSRARWTRQVRKSAENHGIGWIYWELDHGFGFMGDRRVWNNIDRGVTTALFGK